MRDYQKEIEQATNYYKIDNYYIIWFVCIYGLRLFQYNCQKTTY